jgi:hypothetical protein
MKFSMFSFQSTIQKVRIWLNDWQNVEKFYHWGLFALAFTLPTSRFGLSLCHFYLLTIWLFSANWNDKWKIIKQRKGLQLFLGIFLFHAVGMFWSANLTYGLHDLQMKITLFALPLIIGTLPQIELKTIKKISFFLALGVFFHSVFSVSKILGIIGNPVADPRESVGSIGAIRLSVLAVIAIFSLFYLLQKRIFVDKWEKLPAWFLVGWLVLYLFILKSLTGIFLFSFLVIIGLFYQIFKSDKLWLRTLLVLALFGGFYAISCTFLSAWNDLVPKHTKQSVLKSFTEKGNPYINDTVMVDIENGNWVWMNISSEELRAEWAKHSKLDYLGKDKRGQEVYGTLIRYLTSKGLQKDSAGMAGLSSNDIANIENGITNYRFANKFSLYPKIYQLVWQYYMYRNGKSLDGQSVSQRLEYWRVGWSIVQSNFWFGVGTGDVGDAFAERYKKTETRISHQFQFRAHNQYLTFWISLGAFGFVFCVLSLVLPVFFEQKQTSILALMILFITLLSMINEDTLEIQIGATFVSFFYSLFVFGLKSEKEELISPSQKML